MFSGLIYVTLVLASSIDAFAPSNILLETCTYNERSSPLYAIGVLARKAKEADVRKYCETGVEDDVLKAYEKIKSSGEIEQREPGPLQAALTRRKGTITIIAEYKRKVENGGFIDEIFDPEILSPSFREYGARGIAVMADKRMGGCTYDDLATFAEEQRRARNEIPGPVPVINSDLIVDEVQIAQTYVAGAKAFVAQFDIVGEEKIGSFLKAAQALDLEIIVAISSKEDAQKAVDLGARIISVVNIEEVDEKYECVNDLQIPEGQTVTTIASVTVNDDKEFQEIEDAWACRDKGFNTVWVSDALYKSGMDVTENPGTIIKTMLQKSSLKFSSPRVKSGKGEGATEYLGDIMM
eukprot:CAMPEP_0194130178 /NCGR_PEP_ID=MMETSP0152-20130528/1279_1 /TAXON_ID=1049557 /ORGANISM="Thalassiothrix antarctica, Strain L6-D1" /LENGTH=351 /DNA_ID=CAMNT_0038824605 /DNA_START=72 /DNA_END=1127 /DNA_ORIENTATION=+